MTNSDSRVLPPEQREVAMAIVRIVSYAVEEAHRLGFFTGYVRDQCRHLNNEISRVGLSRKSVQIAIVNGLIEGERLAVPPELHTAYIRPVADSIASYPESAGGILFTVLLEIQKTAKALSL